MHSQKPLKDIVNSPSNLQPGDGRNPLRVLGIIVDRALIGLLLVALTASCKPKVSAPEAEAIPDLASIRSKAQQGDAAAQAELGTAYVKGRGVKQDYAEAAKWYRRAAEQGYAGAQAALGELCEIGQGVPRDEAEAAKWYRRAAEQGHTGGEYSLAVLYVMGSGVPKDDAEAVKWYRRAAEQGMAQAQYVLGKRYEDGQGVPRDAVEAYQWLELAAAQGKSDAAQARDELEGTMTREQISEARSRAKAFVPKKTWLPIR